MGRQGREAKVHQIQVPCPHCRVGLVSVIVKDVGDQTAYIPINDQIVGGIKEPVQCLECRGYCAVKVRLDVSLAKYEAKKTNQGEVLRRTLDI